MIAGAYLAHGIRERASELVTIELGPESTMERQAKLVREIDQERLTRIDRALLREAGDAAGGVIDLRTAAGEPRSDFDRQLRIGRLQALERLGLAEEIATGRWRLVPGMEETLRALGERGDIIKTMHRALTRQGLQRAARAAQTRRGRRRSHAGARGTVGCRPRVTRSASSISRPSNSFSAAACWSKRPGGSPSSFGSRWWSAALAARSSDS